MQFAIQLDDLTLSFGHTQMTLHFFTCHAASSRFQAKKGFVVEAHFRFVVRTIRPYALSFWVSFSNLQTGRRDDLHREPFQVNVLFNFADGSVI
jgi:hypothetical protein